MTLTRGMRVSYLRQRGADFADGAVEPAFHFLGHAGQARRVSSSSSAMRASRRSRSASSAADPAGILAAQPGVSPSRIGGFFQLFQGCGEAFCRQFQPAHAASFAVEFHKTLGPPREIGSTQLRSRTLRPALDGRPPPLVKATHPSREHHHDKPCRSAGAGQNPPPRQRHPRAVDGCGGDRQIRPSRPADGHGRCGHRAVLANS